MEISNVSQNPHYPDALLFPCPPKQSKHVEYWTLHGNKLFVKALSLHTLANSYNFFENTATKIPNRTTKKIKEHFEVLVKDIKLIRRN